MPLRLLDDPPSELNELVRKYLQLGLIRFLVGEFELTLVLVKLIMLQDKALLLFDHSCVILYLFEQPVLVFDD